MLDVTDAINSLDPTGTAGIRRSFRADAQRRLNKVRGRTHEFLVGQDFMQHRGTGLDLDPGTKLTAFERWFRQLIMSELLNGWWAHHIERAYQTGVKFGQTYGFAAPMQAPLLLQKTMEHELTGIVEAIIQRVVREIAAGAAVRRPPATMYRHALHSIRTVGTPRLNGLANFMTVRANNRGRLDHFKALGFTHVGSIAERLPRARRRARDALDYNECHDPQTGEFCSTGGGSAAGSGVKSRIRNFVNTEGAKKAISEAASKAAHLAKENRNEILAAAVTFGLYHIVGADFPADVESSLHHEIAHLSTNMKVARGQAHAMMKSAVGKLRRLRGLHDAAGDDEMDAALNKLYRLLVKIEPQYREGGRFYDAPRKPPGPRQQSKIEAAEEDLQELEEVNVETAGDSDVCDVCDEISDDGPYEINSALSLIPAHPNCRCAFVPAHDMRYAINKAKAAEDDDEED